MGGSGLGSDRKRRIFLVGIYLKCSWRKRKAGGQAVKSVCVTMCERVGQGLVEQEGGINQFLPPSLPQGDDLGLELRPLCHLLPQWDAFHPSQAFLPRPRESYLTYSYLMRALVSNNTHSFTQVSLHLFNDTSNSGMCPMIDFRVRHPQMG